MVYAIKERRMKKIIRMIIRIIPLFMLILLCCAFTWQEKEKKVLTEEEMKALAERTLDVWNKGDIALIDELYTADVVRHECDMPEDVIGRDAFKTMLKDIRTAFPDLNLAMDELIIKGNNIVMRWTWKGTNTGPMAGQPPTGKKIQVPGASIVRIVDGKVAEVWDYYNQAVLLQQLGFTLVPPQAEKQE
jgi:steroid delta-isomerase-like uncharacterized protein